MNAPILLREAPCDEDLARAQWYDLIARLFIAPLDEAQRRVLAQAKGDPQTDLGAALNELAACAADTDAVAIKAEFDQIFLGVGRSELLPYASYHLAGFLHERPLVRLREWLSAHDLARADEVSLTEDHLALLADTMRGLIVGGQPAAQALQDQADFFASFIAPWADGFFDSLEQCSSARFYRLAGRLARCFVAIERQAFDFLS